MLESPTQTFPVNIAKFLKTAIFIEHLRTTAFQYTVSH